MGTVNAIVGYCPNLQMLDLGWKEVGFYNNVAAVDSLKGGMKRLKKLNLNKSSVRLGTDWEGY
jgi:hypothetical protein